MPRLDSACNRGSLSVLFFSNVRNLVRAVNFVAKNFFANPQGCALYGSRTKRCENVNILPRERMIVRRINYNLVGY